MGLGRGHGGPHSAFGVWSIGRTAEARVSVPSVGLIFQPSPVSLLRAWAPLAPCEGTGGIRACLASA